MTWLDLPPSGVFQIGFRYAGRQMEAVARHDQSANGRASETPP